MISISGYNPLFKIIFFFIVAYTSSASAAPQVISVNWYTPSDKSWSYSEESELPGSSLHAVSGVALTGGDFWLQGDFEITQGGRYVLDFKNTSIIGHFHHYIFDQNNQLLFSLNGGIQSLTDNPFFLRHGRELDLSTGHYRLISHLSSPYYLAPPVPYLNTLDDYRSSIKGGNALAMAGFGVFFALGLYYGVLAISRRRLAEGMYALFIFGNLLFNAMSLLILPELFGIHWFYLNSFPILFSNAIYVIFVMALLRIQRQTQPRLYIAGISMLGILAVFLFTSFIFPNRSLEFARYGVGIFLCYGLAAGIIRARQGEVTAKLYLLAIGLFFIAGGITITQSQLVGVYTYQIEHIGQFSVAIEMFMLALVLSYQFAQLQRENESISSDFNQERIRREELAMAKAEAERANMAKSAFLSSMSHELRTPMNAIIGYSELLLEEDDLAPQYASDVSQIHKAGNHLLRLINDVLDLAKIESGHIDMSVEEVVVDEVVEECRTLLGTLAEKREIVLSCLNISGHMVRADRIRLKQVLINLLSNAIKYNRYGGRVEVDVRVDGQDWVRILITDTGPGIPKERLAELFEPFNRLDAENSEIEGTGIGLTLSRTIVEQMGGQIGVESTIGKGSCFWITLPYASLPNTGQSDLQIAELLSTENHQVHGQHTVLYIDDNPANLDLVERILSKRPYVNLLISHTPEFGIEQALTHKPEVILLDINMPRMSGYQVLNIFKQEPSMAAIPVIALTASAMPRDIKRGLSSGFSEYLTKPLDVAKFIQILDKYLLSVNVDKNK